MRTVERIVIGSFLKGERRKVGNTETDGRFLRLHGNVIAVREYDGGIYGSLAGFPTRTTRSRLSALASMTNGVGVFQHRGEQRLSTGAEITADEWFRVI